MALFSKNYKLKLSYSDIPLLICPFSITFPITYLDMADIKVRLRFVTKHVEFAVSEAPFAVPMNLGRHGLSKVINHLLDLSEYKSFDFMINDILIRTSLTKFISSYELPVEQIIVVEYMPEASFSPNDQTCETPSWIGCLDSSLKSNLVFAGCYDGSLRIFNPESLMELGRMVPSNANAAPIRDLVYRSQSTSSNPSILLAASKDHKIRAYSVVEQEGSSKSSKKTPTKPTHAAIICEERALFSGHSNSVESVRLWDTKNTGTLVLSGDWSGQLCGWNYGLLNGEEEVADAVKSSSKRRKTDVNSSSSPAEHQQLAPMFSIAAHTQSISGIHCMKSDNDGDFNAGKLLTCSWDHSMKLWDMEKQDVISTYMSSRVATSLDYSSTANGSGLVLTSHPDDRVRSWDIRQREEASSIGYYSALKSNNANAIPQWISQVRWHPTSSTVFATTNYAGAVAVWDIRSSNAPLSKSEPHTGKALCLDWFTDPIDASAATIISGGADCCLRSFQFTA